LKQTEIFNIRKNWQCTINLPHITDNESRNVKKTEITRSQAVARIADRTVSAHFGVT